MQDFYAQQILLAQQQRGEEAQKADADLTARWRDAVGAAAAKGTPPAAVTLHVESCPSRRALNSLEGDNIKLVAHNDTTQFNMCMPGAASDWDMNGGFVIRAARPGLMGFYDRWYDVSTRQ